MQRPYPSLWRIALLLFASGFFILDAAAQTLAGSKPNIILVMTDDQGYGAIGRHGHPWIRTPHLDALHDASVRFTRFSASPSCTPARATIMTGRHALKNGVTAQTWMSRGRMTLDAVTLPQVLKTVGYKTGIFGKWHIGDEDAYQPDRRGFDETFIFGGGILGSSSDTPGNSYFDPVIRHNGRFVKTQGYCTDVFFTQALGWINQRQATKGGPFFAYISLNAPHRPYVAPEKNTKRFRNFGFIEGISRGDAGFYGMIENIDENMGRLMAKLAEWKLLEDTLIIFMSDNGMPGATYGLGEPGTRIGTDASGAPMFPYNAGMKGFKGSVDEGGVRVPFFVRWDRRISPGREIDRIVDHIDILPTLADLAGASLPGRQVEGLSLLPLLERPKAAAEWQDRFLFSHRANWSEGANPDDHQWKNFAVRNQRFRLVGDALFDMEVDPGQTENVAAAHPGVVAAMRAAFNRFWKEARPLMVNEGLPTPSDKPFRIHYEKQLQTEGISDWQRPRL